MGRKPLPIDAEQVYKIARLGCTHQEIADFFGCHPDTIRDRFPEELARARAAGKISLRRAQRIRAIRDRSDRMLIHLGQIELGQVVQPPPPEADIDEILDEADRIAAQRHGSTPGAAPGPVEA